MGAAKTQRSNEIDDIANWVGVEHGDEMPTKGKVPIPPPDYSVNQTGEHLFTWKDQVTGEIFRIAVSHPNRSGMDFWCMLSVIYQQDSETSPTLILPGKRWNLYSTSNTDGQIRSLNRRMPERLWDARLAQVEGALTSTIEVGDDLLDLNDIENPPPPAYLVWPLLEENEHNGIGADGGSTKSILAMALCVAFSSGKPIIEGTTVPRSGRASLFLDYESSKRTQAYRRRQLLNGASIDTPANKIYYKRMYSPITDAARELYDIIKSRNIGLVVIDSGSRAVGGETSSENMVIPYFNAVASWGITVLTVVHKAKDKESRGPSGVAQWWNQFRNYWELVKDQTPGQPEVYVTLRHDKANDESLHEPLNYRLEFGHDFIRYHKETMAISNTILNEMPISIQIRSFLDNFPQSTAKEIGMGIEKGEKHVGNELSKNEGKLFYGTAEARGRRWTNIESNPAKSQGRQDSMYWMKD
jgi:hypothetical protein